MERRPRRELHAGGDLARGPQVEGLPGRDQRPGPGRGDADDPGSQASGLRGRASERVALRNAAASCGRGGGRGSHGEARAEERQAGCLRPGREAADRIPRQEDLQGASGVHAAPGALANAHHGDARSGAGPGAAEEPVSIPRDLDAGRLGLQRGTARRMAGATLTPPTLAQRSPSSTERSSTSMRSPTRSTRWPARGPVAMRPATEAA
jgi:hypothetical protein